MFGWVRKLFSRNRSPERFLFRYRDGRNARSCDPVEAERALCRRFGEDWRREVAKIGATAPPGLVGDQLDGWKESNEKHRQSILDGVCDAFGVSRYRDDGVAPPTGLTESELLGLLAAYMLFCRDLVEYARPFLTRLPRESPGGGNPRPSNTPGSNSTDGGSPGNGPTPSPVPF